MLNHVLVPLDGSKLSEQALVYAEDMIPPESKVTLVSVIEIPVDYDYSLVDVPLTIVTTRAYNEGEFDRAYRRVHDYLLTHAHKLRKKGFDVECVIESGDPAAVIVDTVRQCKPKAVVMSTHGRTGFSRWLFGSVTQKVISLMPCPIMVVPGNVADKVEDSVPKKATAT